jgi:hypothetical protein
LVSRGGSRNSSRSLTLVIYVPGGKRIAGEDEQLFGRYFPVDLANTTTTLIQKILQALKEHPLTGGDQDVAETKQVTKA